MCDSRWLILSSDLQSFSTIYCVCLLGPMPAKRNFKRPAAATAAGFTEAGRETFKECMGQGMKRKAVIGAMSITKAKHSLLSKAYVAEIETKICESGSAGKGPVAIAKEMQMPQQTVSNILKKHGIKPAEQRKRAFAKERDAGALLKDVTVQASKRASEQASRPTRQQGTKAASQPASKAASKPRSGPK